MSTSKPLAELLLLLMSFGAVVELAPAPDTGISFWLIRTLTVMLTIYLDADACPVKEETYRVARRYSMRVVVVANAPLRVPADPLVELVVQSGFGAADDWIVEQAGPGDIVVTADIPLAARCLAKEARVLNPKGREFTDNDIGSVLATRNLMDELRQGGAVTGGPAAMTAKDRSRFLAKLDEVVNALRRDHHQRQ
jgi:uncharacterized protein YaiI (UPF0178 family)